MSEREWVTSSAEESISIGRELAARLSAPALVFLTGDLGAGKTTLAKGIIGGLGAAREEDVTSPTFTLVHVFHNHLTVYHVDLYRITSLRDLETLGLEDVFDRPAIVIVEWAEKFLLRSDWPVIRIHLEHAGEDKRRIRVEDSAGVLAAGTPASRPD
ncbi:MAG TPA: tRNA (adenosine(37)-N6)-threonylcarbamoyltransferase complex ATPase subunit type 1 TsaE [Patescibacteria group bacterium]|nr:tRNA (adenosine(37)-N6)-threonylcarbamoyltransferase complex ATPase subunit type 1 TsaE [Patescibacteria group bacterium]